MGDKSLHKITIWSYKDKEFNTKLSEFKVPINPESYSQNYKINLDTEKGHGQQGTDPKYKSTEPEQFKLDIILDGTKTMEGYDASHDRKTVKQQLDDFQKCVYFMEGEIHRPRFLKIFWGEEINFPCVLSQLDINYTLFNPDGSPLRIKISATFLKYLSEKKREAEQQKKSPDLTHERIAGSGDRLDLLTYNIYNDPKYFLQVARINELTTLRKLRVGNKLFFPPFNKNEG
ncbi:MAG: hypothetical protein ABI691_06100 [Ginsengibacter sp.]